MTAEILQLMFQKGLNQLDFFNHIANQSVFFKIKDVASYALLKKFLKIQILAGEGFKLFACLAVFDQFNVKQSGEIFIDYI